MSTESESSQWLKLAWQGKGVDYYQSAAASGWVLDPRTCEGQVVKTLKLRCNLWPSKACLGQSRDIANVNCRLCDSTAETVGHISGYCVRLKDARIARHNWVVNTLTRDLKRQKIRHIREPMISNRSSNNIEVLKPDISVLPEPKKYDVTTKAVILDPTIVLENGRSLHNADKGTIRKYEPLVAHIKREYKVDEVIISGIAIGARGGWLNSNGEAPKAVELGDTALHKNLRASLTRRTLSILRTLADA